MILIEFLLSTILFICSSNGLLEDDILYDIKWQNELPSPIDVENSLMVKSKRNENYFCSLPIVESKEQAIVETILFSEVENLLNNLHPKRLCAYRLDPYWTYELCHGTHIRQYHDAKVAGKKSTLQEYFLGYFNVEHQDIFKNGDGENVLKIDHKTIDNKQRPSLPIRYTFGTPCEIGDNQPRETIVHYICDERGNDGILNFEETSSCNYEMIIASKWLCKSSIFNLVESNRYSINCFPQENGRAKPKNLRKLEEERQNSLKNGGRAQFTVTGTDGTTFIISYQYANEADLNEFGEAVSREQKENLIENSASTENFQEKPFGNLGNDVDREFLENFLSGRECLPGGTGWWRYEICYGKHVIQFHEEGQHRISILLGTWNREKHIEFLNKNPKKKPGNIRDRQFVSLFYTDGDICELTKTRRTVEVKLRCLKKAESSHATSMYLVEPETCSYVLGVESPLFCNFIEFTDEFGVPDMEKLLKTLKNSH